MDLDGIDAAFLYPSVGPVRRRRAGARARRRDVPRLQPLARRLLPALPRPALRRGHAADAVDRAGHRGDALRAHAARHARRLPAPQSLQRPHAPPPGLRAVLARGARSSTSPSACTRAPAAACRRSGVDRFETRGARHIISHTMEMMLAAMSVIWGGVCDRHPRVRIGFLESGGGWIAPWLDRMDRHFDDQGFNDSGLSHAAERAVPAQLLDLVRAGRGQPRACSPTTSARTRSCGRPTIRIPTASSPARPR